jgi:hypothetical protein
MRTIKSKFKHLRGRNSIYSSYLIFAEVIKGCGYPRRSIREKFNELVDIEDYDKSNKKQILKYLYSLSEDALYLEKEGKTKEQNLRDIKWDLFLGYLEARGGYKVISRKLPKSML